MKTHIIFLSLTALLLASCASKEGRSVASTQDTQEQKKEYAKFDTNAGRDISGHDSGSTK